MACLIIQTQALMSFHAAVGHNCKTNYIFATDEGLCGQNVLLAFPVAAQKT